MTNAESWDRIAAKYLADTEFDAPGDVVRYGTDLATDRELRLCGIVKGKRVLDLGCGSGHNAMALAQQGAYAIALDSCSQMLAHGRRVAEERELRLEWHLGDLADLAWLRADSVDLALCVGVLAEIEDLDRAFRQVHRVLRTGAPFVFTYDHPMAMCVWRDHTADGELPLGRLEVRRSYFDTAPVAVTRCGEAFTLHPRTLADLFGALGRAGFAIDALHEMELIHSSDPGPRVPSIIAVRAKKLGN